MGTSRSTDDIESDLFKLFGEDSRCHLSLNFEIGTIRSNSEHNRAIYHNDLCVSDVILEKNTLKSVNNFELDLVEAIGDELLDSSISSDSDDSIPAVDELLDSESFHQVEILRLKHLLGAKNNDEDIQ